MTAAIPIFVGPTLASLHRDPPPWARPLPPARAGDILALLADPPPAIGIIDGAFENAPSLWHKEILLALSRGIAVFGAASLGALRAAELDGLGMIGIGQIYDRYRAGLIERDDAVMVAHAPAELDWAPLTIALVDIEATVDALAPTLAEGEAGLLRAQAQLIHYRDRDWPTLANCVARRIGDPARAAPLARRLADAAVELKRDDALALVRALAAWRRHPVRPPPVTVPPTPWLLDLAHARGLDPVRLRLG